MKKILPILIIFQLLVHILSYGQMSKRDSFLTRLIQMDEDTNKVKTLWEFAGYYFFSKPDSSRIIGYQGLDLARKLNYREGIVWFLNTVSESERFTGNYPIAIKLNLEALRLYREMLDKEGEARTLGFLGFSYVEFREYRKALEYLLEAVRLNKESQNIRQLTFSLSNTGNAYYLLNLYDSAMYYHQLARNNFPFFDHGPVKTLALSRLAATFLALGQKDSAFNYYHLALKNTIVFDARVHKSKIERQLAEFYEQMDRYDSSLYYGRQAFGDSKSNVQRFELLQTSELLSRLFRKTGNADSAFYYDDIAKAMRDSLYGPEKFGQLQVLMMNEEQQKAEIIRKQDQFKSRIKIAVLLAASIVFLVIAFILLRANRHKQRLALKIQQAYTELKETQLQLVQKEKMASLGELTAGIAHEIQNPLNFVNNFSEVNGELIEELKSELYTGTKEEAILIANNIKENEQKINHHGKRADAIIKGMLQHSRTATGKKELCDINALADEYLRLSYHGLRAKDKEFNATTKTDFDQSIGLINIIPGDIGRVLLNLYNNAFYAVTEKVKLSATGYQPTVTVTTKRLRAPLGDGGKVEISVSDNGNGIPQTIVDKIFQPFFTTKPAGEGTGLGLSLAYDIVKAHGGELKVETKEGEGVEFSLLIPVHYRSNTAA